MRSLASLLLGPGSVGKAPLEAQATSHLYSGWISVSGREFAGFFTDSLLSAYCRPTSATASLILLRTVRSGSVPRVSRSFWRMTAAWSLANEKKMSTLFPDSTFRVLEAIRRNITAAKDRACVHGVRDNCFGAHRRAM
jgi:hypothetical protein